MDQNFNYFVNSLTPGSMELQVALGLIIATVLGAFLGLERSLAGKHAGMRTYALVSLGSALFTAVGVIASIQMSYFASINPLQIAASVAIGIGFIGTGLSVFRGEHPVELTTATGIWVAAAVGVACGFGLYAIATIATVLTVLIFTFLLKLENRFRRRYGTSTD
jgi:putative Mg2+ transporter-C (MgtC) family protein